MPHIAFQIGGRIAIPWPTENRFAAQDATKGNAKRARRNPAKFNRGQVAADIAKTLSKRWAGYN